jgi:hypothetical protein
VSAERTATANGGRRGGPSNGAAVVFEAVVRDTSGMPSDKIDWVPVFGPWQLSRAVAFGGDQRVFGLALASRTIKDGETRADVTIAESPAEPMQPGVEDAPARPLEPMAHLAGC